MITLPVEITSFAENFARAIAQRDFASAHAMLSLEQKTKYTIASLKDAFYQMITYSDFQETENPQTNVETTLTTWGNKKENDIGWVYVSIVSDSFSEAVNVVVSKEGDKKVIADVEWGRP
jgi:hypothetical protein